MKRERMSIEKEVCQYPELGHRQTPYAQGRGWPNPKMVPVRPKRGVSQTQAECRSDTSEGRVLDIKGNNKSSQTENKRAPPRDFSKRPSAYLLASADKCGTYILKHDKSVIFQKNPLAPGRIPERVNWLVMDTHNQNRPKQCFSQLALRFKSHMAGDGCGV